MKIFSFFTVVFVVFLNVCAVLPSLDPYATLGVARSASQKQIKKSYKQLAREWHPDKNSDPEAGDRFIEIQRAYEILSDEEKRSHFDRYGYVDDNANQQQRGNTNMFRGFQFPGDGRFSFKFSSNGGGQRSHHSRVTLRKLEGEIFPESYSKPFVLLLTGDWCFSCIRIEGVWDQISTELENSGIGSGKVNSDYDYNVLGRLGVYSKPAIVVVIQETVYKYNGNEISSEHLKNFVASLIPTNIITGVNDDNRNRFLSQFQATNKPSVVLFTRRSTPSALYKLLAFQFHQKMNFGFVQTTDSMSKDTISKFDVKWNQREMLIFKEDVETPAEDMEISNIEFGDLKLFLSENQHLYAPRLTSQSLYEHLCPESPYSHSKSFCVILSLKQSQEFSQTHESFIQAARTTDDLPVKVKFAYLVEEKQQEFMQRLGQPNSSDRTLPVLVLWRVGSRKAHWQWTPDGWQRDEPDADKARLGSFLANIKWTKAKELPELNDEFAPNILVRFYQAVIGKLKAGFRSVWSLFAQGSLNEVSLVMTVALIYILCILLMFFGIISPKPDIPPRQESSDHTDHGTRHRDRDVIHSDGEVRHRRPSPHNRTSEARQIPDKIRITQLNAVTFDTHIRNLPKSRILLVLLVTEETKMKLFRLLKREIYRHVINSSVLTLAHLNLDKYLDWCNQLLSKDYSKNRLLGSVLALRPSKSYFYIFGSNIEDSRDPFDYEGDDRLEHALDRLDMWIEKLLDGGLERQEVDHWPELED